MFVYFQSLTLMEDLMSVLHHSFYTNIYPLNSISLSYNLTSQGEIKANIRGEGALPLSIGEPLAHKIPAHFVVAQLTLIVF